jgi:hypothetical protein
MLTQPQIAARTKTVTRRNGWAWLQPGTILNGVNKSQGLKKGEHPVKLATIRVVSVRREPLSAITKEDVVREGFAGWTPEQFIAFYAGHNGGDADMLVTRIEFEYVENGGGE